MVSLSDGWIRHLPRSVAILFVCAVAAVALDALLFLLVTKAVAETSQEIVTDRAEVDQLVAARDLLLDAETGVRGFLLTGQPQYLEPYNAATVRANALLNDIASRHHEPSAQAQTEAFNRLAHAKLDELARTLDTYRSGDRAKALEMAGSGAEKQVMDDIRALVEARRSLLEQRVEQLRTNRDRTIRLATVANIAAALLAIGVLIFFTATTSRRLFGRQKLEQKPQNSNIDREPSRSTRRELEDSLHTIRAELPEATHGEDRLHVSEERFRLLVAGVRDYAIFMLDPEGNISSWNIGAERIKGYSSEEIIGKHFSIFYTDDDRKANVPRNALQIALRDGKYEAEAWRVRKGGVRFFANVVIDPLRDPSGKLIGFAKITRDMTERRQQQLALDEAKSALAQSQKMEALGQLSGGVAHDFNNLLHVIRNAAEVLDRRMPQLDPELRSMFEMIKRNADRAASLTKRLLAFSRRQPLEPQPVDPNKLVQGMDALLKSALGEAISLQVVCGSDVWIVSADPNQLETALLNLAVNARDAMPKGGKLTIETTNASLDEGYAAADSDVKVGQYVLISVSDTGIGMSSEVVARAFEPFFTTKDIGQGTGLGLSQVYGFVKQSGGHVKIYSEFGHGTTVKLYLPRLGMPAASDPPEPLRAAPAGRATETILVVEDEEEVLTFTASILRELGYRVLTASDAESALVVLDKEKGVDLLFTDVGLPRINGRQLADDAIQRWPALKVLFTTGYGRNAIFHHGRLDPGVELIVKPFTQSGLADKIRKVLDRA